MDYITLNNGVKMPIMGLGTYLLSPNEAENAVFIALNNGYELIDTANAYVNEKAVGRAIKKSSLPRDKIFLETKLWPCFYKDDKAIDKTLKRLDVDYIDLMILHQPAGDILSGYRLLEKAYKRNVTQMGLSFVCFTVLSLVLIPFSPIGMMNIYIVFAITLFINGVFAVFMVTPLASVFEKKFKNTKLKERRAKKLMAKREKLAKQNRNKGAEPEEIIIPGIND